MAVVTTQFDNFKEYLEQLLTLTEANAKAIAALEARQAASQQQIENLRIGIIELRESQAVVMQQFCTEHQAALQEFRKTADGTLSRLERTLDVLLAQAENQGQLITELGRFIRR